MSNLEALIFDVDGTLADTERDGHRVAFNRAFAEAGLDWHWTESLYGELLSVSGGKERIRYFLDRFNTSFRRPADLGAFIADLHSIKTRHYLAMLQDGAVPLRPGVRRLLEEARAEGLVLAIATTTTPANVDYLVESTLGARALEWFSVIAAGDIVQKKKPAPDIYYHALQQLRQPAGRCLAIEDSDNGIQSSLGAGVPTLITVNGYTLGQDFSGALMVVDQLGEPDQPYTLLGGTATPGAKFVDVGLCHELLSQI